MIKPRNTLVVVRIIDESTKKIGSIVVSTNAEMYAEADVLAVGPGNINASGARAETHDLKVGQRVLVKHQDVKPRGNEMWKAKTYIEYAKDDVKYQIFEQSHIVAILAEPDPVINGMPCTSVSMDPPNGTAILIDEIN